MLQLKLLPKKCMFKKSLNGNKKSISIKKRERNNQKQASTEMAIITEHYV